MRMIPILLLCSGLAVALASPARAVAVAKPAHSGLDLSWRACGTAARDSAMTLDCANLDSIAVLYGTFQVPDTITRAAALTVYLDVIIEDQKVPGFWHLEPEGCNRTGVVFMKELPEDVCPGTTSFSAAGGMSMAALTSRGNQFDKGRTRVRLVGMIAISATTPMTLVPGVDYHAFQLRFYNDKARETGDQCDGCRTPVAIGWSSAKIERVHPEFGKAYPEIILTGPGRRTNRVALNGPRPETLKELDSIEILGEPAPDQP